MAITEVGSGSQRNSVSQGAQSTTGTLAFPANVASGNLLIVAGSVFNAGVTITGVTDTRGTTYTVIQDSGSTNHSRYIAYGIAPSSGANTVTVTSSANGYHSFGIDEFTGVDATPLSVNGGSSTGTSTAPSDSITTLTAGELIIGCLGIDIGSGTVVITAGQTEIGQEGNANNFETYGASFQIAGAAGSYSQTWTLGASQTWRVLTASFEADAGGSPQTLTDTLFTNTNQFFSDTIVGGAVATAFQADAFQNDAFQIEVSGSPQTLTDSLFTNNNTFFGDTIVPGSVTLTDTLFTNTNQFFGDIINQAGGPQTLVDSLFTNTNTFFSDTIISANGAIMVQWEPSADPNVTGYFVYWDTVSHAGGVYTDYAFSADVLGNAAAQYLITGLTVGQTYYINISSHGAGGHDANESALWGEITDTASDLSLWQFLTDGLRYENPNTFFNDVIVTGNNQVLTDSLYTNTNTFFADTIQPGTATLTDTLFTNSNTFFSDTINQAGGAQTLVDSLFTNNNTFFGDTIQPGEVTLSDSLFTNTNQFFSDTITQGAPNQTLVDSLFTNANQFFTDTVTVGTAFLGDSLFVNENQFFQDTLQGGIPVVTTVSGGGVIHAYSPSDLRRKQEESQQKTEKKKRKTLTLKQKPVADKAKPVVNTFNDTLFDFKRNAVPIVYKNNQKVSNYEQDYQQAMINYLEQVEAEMLLQAQIQEEQAIIRIIAELL